MIHTRPRLRVPSRQLSTRGSRGASSPFLASSSAHRILHPRGTPRIDDGSDITVLQILISTFPRASDGNIHHRPGRVGAVPKRAWRRQLCADAIPRKNLSSYARLAPSAAEVPMDKNASPKADKTPQASPAAFRSAKVRRDLRAVDDALAPKARNVRARSGDEFSLDDGDTLPIAGKRPRSERRSRPV